jgi:hypothetical protein
MYTCVRGIEFGFVSMVFLLDFWIVSTVWYVLLFIKFVEMVILKESPKQLRFFLSWTIGNMDFVVKCNWKHPAFKPYKLLLYKAMVTIGNFMLNQGNNQIKTITFQPEKYSNTISIHLYNYARFLRICMCSCVYLTD